MQAVKDDEYGEYTLETGDILITDWEGDGFFSPYVIPEASPRNDDEAMANISSSIKNELGIRVTGVEWDISNDVYHVVPKNRYIDNDS